MRPGPPDPPDLTSSGAPGRFLRTPGRTFIVRPGHPGQARTGTAVASEERRDTGDEVRAGVSGGTARRARDLARRGAGQGRHRPPRLPVHRGLLRRSVRPRRRPRSPPRPRPGRGAPRLCRAPLLRGPRRPPPRLPHDRGGELRLPRPHPRPHGRRRGRIRRRARRLHRRRLRRRRARPRLPPPARRGGPAHRVHPHQPRLGPRRGRPRPAGRRRTRRRDRRPRRQDRRHRRRLRRRAPRRHHRTPRRRRHRARRHLLRTARHPRPQADLPHLLRGALPVRLRPPALLPVRRERRDARLRGRLRALGAGPHLPGPGHHRRDLVADPRLPELRPPVRHPLLDQAGVPHRSRDPRRPLQRHREAAGRHPGPRPAPRHGGPGQGLRPRRRGLVRGGRRRTRRRPPRAGDLLRPADHGRRALPARRPGHQAPRGRRPRPAPRERPRPPPPRTRAAGPPLLLDAGTPRRGPRQAPQTRLGRPRFGVRRPSRAVRALLPRRPARLPDHADLGRRGGECESLARACLDGYGLGTTR